MIPTSQQFNDITKKTLSSSGLVVWMTGLSGAGKTTIARKVERWLSANSLSVHILDGDDLRTGLNSDLGYSVADRNENIRRISEVANILRTAGCIVLISSISPIREQRALAKERIGAEYFIEVYVHTEMEECIRRDPKGLYKKALAGEITNFTGIDSPYEAPESPDLTIHTDALSVVAASDLIIEKVLMHLKIN